MKNLFKTSAVFVLMVVIFASCEKDEKGEDENPEIPANENTFTDSRDGHTYKWIKIGDQTWMAENLAYLPEVQNNNDFVLKGKNEEPAYGVYDYDGSDVDSAKAKVNYTTYGVLYTWYTIDQTHVCPSGWHVPSDEEWKTLEIELGMSPAFADSTHLRGTDQGSQLAGNTDLWSNGYLKTNEKFGLSGFNGLPGGYRYSGDGTFGIESRRGYWWTSSVQLRSNAYFRRLDHDYASIFRTNMDKGTGYSIRCIKD